MIYELNRFSPQSFERLIQALAASVLGIGVQIFGVGRDGAREATYNGKCRISGDECDGYVVIQAKYRQSSEGTKNNPDWLKNQIDIEMSKFEEKRRSLQKPDYYLIASNVRLSASAGDSTGKGEGGIDKVTKHLKYWSDKLGIKGVYVWHADTIGAFLDANEEIRTTFSFWVQPGDVLASLLRTVGEPRHEEVLFRYMRRGIRDSRDIKTRDMGQVTGRTIALDALFIDLPIDQKPVDTRSYGGAQPLEPEGEPISEADYSEVDENVNISRFAGKANVLASLMVRAADKFDLSGCCNNVTLPPPKDPCLQKGPLENRVVILGGPGQGKSTIGQFMAQLCRARLLHSTKQSQTPEINGAIQAILARALNEKIPVSGPPRLPIHIELPRFADALSDANRKDEDLTVLSYVARQVSKASEETVTGAMLRRWLAKVPSVVILDGLDEVPRSGNRADVIAAIEELLDAIHEVNADCLIFATSRPQGYQGELSRKIWAHWTLEPLDGDEALKFARHLAPVLVADETRQEEILEILSKASAEETTSQLMISPLQVTLLFQLVATHNNIPDDRWTLFHRHYETMRDREIAKGGSTGQIIGKFKPQIDRIHYDAGYILHVRSESNGSADAFFTVDEFSAIVKNQLIIDGYDEDNEKLTHDIVGIATDRLVFLRSGTEGHIAFDVRSLQEFMAAARLTTSPESSIRERLYEFAGRAHWLHVFKIACSKIFASANHEALRDSVIALLDSFDEGDRDSDDRIVKMGARLAVELIADGAALTVPAFRKKLLVRALRLISVPGNQLNWKIASTIDYSARSAAELVLTEAMSTGNEITKGSVLSLLAIIYALNEGPLSNWAELLLLNWWPDDSERVLQIFEDAVMLPREGKVAERLRLAQWNCPVREVQHWVWRLSRNDSYVPEHAIICSGIWRSESVPLICKDGTTTELSLKYYSIEGAPRLMTVPPSAQFEWKVMQAAVIFGEAPSQRTLAAFLRVVAELNVLEEAYALAIPWTLKAMLKAAKDASTLLVCADEVEAGSYGDIDLWSAAEDRWNRNGIMQHELSTIRETGIPRDINVRGAPLISGRQTRSHFAPAIDELLDLVERVPTSSWAKRALLFCARRPVAGSSERLRAYLSTCPLPTDSADLRALSIALIAQIAVCDDAALITRLRDLLSSDIAAGSSAYIVVSLRSLDAAVKLIKEFNATPRFRSFIPPIASLLRNSRSVEAANDLDQSAFEFHESDTAYISSSVAQILIYAQRVNSINLRETANKLVESPTAPLFSVLRGREYGREDIRVSAALRREVCLALLTNPARVTHVNAANDTLVELLESKKTSLADPDVAAKLALPLDQLPVKYAAQASMTE